MTRDDVIAALPALGLEDLSAIKFALDAEIQKRLHGLGVAHGLTSEERRRVAEGDKLGCVKMIRDRTGLGLRDAKDYMDTALERMP